MVIWITGMSGAGKTTISQALSDLVKPRISELILIDGDAVRELYGNDLDYAEASRSKHISRVRSLAKFLETQGQVVVVAALYSHPDLLTENRRILAEYFEVYLQAPLDLLRARDSKGLYAGALSGRIPNVVGVDIPWHAPLNPDLVLDCSNAQSPREMALKIAHRVPRLRAALSEGAA
ncbi:unnamed protein product [Phaeothamnion confervicola]